MNMCKQNGCKNVAENKVYWPGQETEMCATCTVRAVRLARHMGFELSTSVLGLPSLEEIKAALSTMGK